MLFKEKILLRILLFTLLESIFHIHETQAWSMKQLLKESVSEYTKSRGLSLSFLQATLILILDVCLAHIERQISSFSLRKYDTPKLELWILGLGKALFCSCCILIGQYILTLFLTRTP